MMQTFLPTFPSYILAIDWRIASNREPAATRVEEKCQSTSPERLRTQKVPFRGKCLRRGQHDHIAAVCCQDTGRPQRHPIAERANGAGGRGRQCGQMVEGERDLDADVDYCLATLVAK